MDPSEAEGIPGPGPAPEAQPDLMNDPAFDTNVKSKQNRMDEADTCRICRGEGSKEEPLFYPCKCSGSIKFVHQNCLMEWLSHSQKKYCELCKTTFRFTKLYLPHMPDSVPLPVFLHQAAIHTWKSFLTWARFHLVMFVWVAWLPWCMRTIWRGLFWIGDGGWVSWTDRRLHNQSMTTSLPAELATGNPNPAEHMSSTSKEAFASAFISTLSRNVHGLFSPVRQLFTITSNEPLGLRFSRRLYQYATAWGSSSSLSATTSTNVSHPLGSVPRSSSWLSEIRFLRNLTRSTMVNNLVIDTLEGQLITLLVVVAFILVFLIREWVVQQQPNLDGGADLNIAIAAGQAPEIPVPDEHADERHHAPEGEEHAEAANDHIRLQNPRARIIARARPRRPRLPRQASGQDRDQVAETADGGDAANSEDLDLVSSDSILHARLLPEASHKSASEADANLPQRPMMPDRDTLARAAEIRQAIEEQARIIGDQDSPAEILRYLMSQAEDKPLEVIRIIEAQGRSDELAWIIAGMRKLEEINRADKQQSLFHSPKNLSIGSTSGRSLTEDGPGRLQQEDEGFVLLDRPTLTPSPEAEPGRSEDPNAPSFSSRGQAVRRQGETSSRSPKAFASLESPHSDPKSQEGSLMSVGDSNSQISEPNTSRGQGQTSSLGHHQSGVAENPFSTDYVGDLPGPPTLYRVTTAGDLNLDNAEADQPHDSPIGQSDTQTYNNFAHENFEQPRSIIETMAEWLWGGVALPPGSPEQPAGDDEHVVHDIAAEEPFVRVDRGQPVRPAPNDAGPAGQDPEVVAAAIQAGIDPNEVEAVDDIDDLEGILELVGMQGPLAGLVQNGMFCAVLISLTILFGIWIPYISGKAFLVIITHPISLLLKLPLRWAASIADMIIDFFTFIGGCAFYWLDTLIRIFCAPVGWLMPSLGTINQNNVLANISKRYAESALERLANALIATGNTIAASDIPTFSLVAHESLRWIESTTSWLLQSTIDRCVYCFNTVANSPGNVTSVTFMAFGIANCAKVLRIHSMEYIRSFALMAPSVFQINPLRIDVSIPQRTAPLDYTLAYWNTRDRTLAVIFGYVFFAFLGVVYLKLSIWIRGINKAGRVEGAIADGLYQAGGVMKVVLIISIEMIVFPLYCGLLLDVALLPLFGNVTLVSRVNFMLSSPNTSIFVHWFVGTCYMFHFALFVSMCRKILRSGVLYFIRDPDDPTFHPVRDVLERSVSTQLWKISFSALVYGGLVIVCLGGVVWGIAYAFDGVLPIHWSSNEPVLEFPVDLLFYNFLMPLAVRFFKPSKGLNKMYSWWFRKCARALRLTNFLFGERKADEEGSHLRRAWVNFMSGLQSDTQKPPIGQVVQDPPQIEHTEASFVRDGRHVRAPASDQVRIPKGAHTFLEVDEENRRIDNEPDPEDGIHGSKNEMFTKVYIPPLFRLRISLFILLIWLFAATTGVSATILPLVFGRFIFATLAPSHLHMNDIYAFSIGMYVLGGAFYGIFYHRRVTSYLYQTFKPHTTTVTSVLCKSASLLLRLLSLIYTYGAFGIFIPGLLSLVMEFYLVIPLHTYFSTTYTAIDSTTAERHIIHLIQDWTLGVLYLKMAARVILFNAPSRPAAALRGIVRDGWLKPDVRLATRGFILPATFAVGIALAAPLALGWLASSTVLHSYSTNNEVFKACVYRYSYPGVLALGFAIGFFVLVGKAFAGWRKRVRDEVYLIGERLHNFGETKRGAGKGKGRA